MSISVNKIKRWYLMIAGNSIYHVAQEAGKCFSTNEIKGYYNDLTQKVTKYQGEFFYEYVPKNETIEGKIVEFPVAIFQFGLGAYDLFLLEKNELDMDKFKSCVKWAYNHQNDDGSWNNFSFIYPNDPYSAMAQGEGASLLIRAYKEFNEVKYLEAARKAIYFMLKDINDGGTAKRKDESLILLEYTNKEPVLNGWIFALWGLFDYYLAIKDEHIKNELDKTIKTLKERLPEFSKRYWSKYNLDKMLASPFYHHLHIAQMKVMYEITKDEIFASYAERWGRQYNNMFCKALAFVIKAFQKISERAE